MITTPPTSRFPELDEGVNVLLGNERPRATRPGTAAETQSASRTAAPLPTISQRSSMFATASWRNRAGDTSKARILVRAVVSN